MDEAWKLVEGAGHIVGVALHASHIVRPEMSQEMHIGSFDRRCEEDPYTSFWTSVAETRLIALRSRFEVDFNRSRDKAVYLQPEDAWGLRVWRKAPSPKIIERSLKIYDDFYFMLDELIHRLTTKYSPLVIFDLHSYNHLHKRLDPIADDADKNPDINIGTGTMTDRSLWEPIIDRVKTDLQNFDFLGGSLDIRENVKFSGGYFARHLHKTFPKNVCVLSIEFKKTFMDERTGRADWQKMKSIKTALFSIIPGINVEIEKMSDERR